MDKIIEAYKRQNKFGKWLGMNFNILDLGKIEYRFCPNENHEALTGMTHGGAIAALMDGVLGVAALSAVANQGKYVATIEFKLNYLQPAKTHEQLLAKGEVIKRGGKILVCEGKIYNPRNDLVATALGSFRAYPAPNDG